MKYPNRSSYIEKEIFKKEMMSILSKLSFSAIIIRKNNLQQYFKREEKIGPSYIIGKEKIGEKEDCWYSEKYGFHFNLNLDMI